MQCRKVNSLLSAFLDHELESSENAHVTEHLDRCRNCRQELDSLRQTKWMLSSLAQRAPRAELDRLALPASPEPHSRLSSGPISPRTFAAAFLSLVGVWVGSTRLATHDDRNGPPLPDGAYRIPASSLAVCGPSPCGLETQPRPSTAFMAKTSVRTFFSGSGVTNASLIAPSMPRRETFIIPASYSVSPVGAR